MMRVRFKVSQVIATGDSHQPKESVNLDLVQGSSRLHKFGMIMLQLVGSDCGQFEAGDEYDVDFYNLTRNA